MGKFDGVLLCTDWDGTLYYQNGFCCKDLDAVRAFQREGGKFTFCTGRHYRFLEQFTDSIRANTYISSLNGACIVSPDDGRFLYRGGSDEKVFDIMEAILGMGTAFDRINVTFRDTEEAATAYTVPEYLAALPRIRRREIYKIILYSSYAGDCREDVLRINREVDLGHYEAVRSWAQSVELIPAADTKGAAVRRIADAVGAGLLVCVGDYENDISMLRAADIGYAVGNAPDTVKSVAARVTVPCYEGAISHIIRDLESEMPVKK